MKTTKKTTKKKAREELSALGKGRCRIAADSLRHAFYWAQSREGHEYWQGIHDRLQSLSGRGSL